MEKFFIFRVCGAFFEEVANASETSKGLVVGVFAITGLRGSRLRAV